MSLRAFENRVKVIAVAKIGNAFKKAQIVNRIIQSAKAQNHIATGKLTTPKSSRSIIPFSDDRWLVRKDAITVRAVSLPSGQYMVSKFRVRLRYGLNFRYQALASYTPKQKVASHSAIAQWIVSKGERGGFKHSSGRPLNLTNKNEVNSLAYVIARSIRRKGVRKTSFANHFMNRQTGVEATLNRGMRDFMARLDQLYATSIETSIVNLLNKNF